MIESERLLLRPFDSRDLDIILMLYSDEEIMRYMPLPVMNPDAAQQHLQKITAAWQAVPQVNFEMAVVRKDTNEKIGRAEITRNFSEGSAMIGWIVCKRDWGKGFATEIARALIAYCFGTLQVHRVYALCHPDNIGSWKVMEKCGMRREAHYRQKCKYTKADGIRWEDELEYALLETEV